MIARDRQAVGQDAPARAAGAGDASTTTLADIYRKVALVAVIFLALSSCLGVLIALQHPPAAAGDHGGDAGDHLRRITTAAIQGTKARDEIGEMARAVEVFRENAIAKRKAENELRASKEQAERRAAGTARRRSRT